jgi:hypothetical protein
MRKKPRDFVQADIEKGKIEQNQRDKVKMGQVFQSRFCGARPNYNSPDSTTSEVTFTNDSCEKINIDKLKLDFDFDEQVGSYELPRV